MVMNNHVTFEIALGGGIIAAQCAVVLGSHVLEEVDCKCYTDVALATDSFDIDFTQVHLEKLNSQTCLLGLGN